MKKIFIATAAIFLMALQISAQAPQKFNYQAVCRDNAGNIIAGQAVGIRISVYDSTAGGTLLYQESHNLSTNAYGLVNIAVGTGTVISGNFTSIPWAAGEKYMEVEVDAGSGFASVGVIQLLSVPYALYAAQSGSGGTMPAGSNGQTLRHDGAGWAGSNVIYNDGTSVGMGTTTPAAFVDMNSTLNGVLFPRMTTAERDAIANPAQSVVIFNTTTNCFETYLGMVWQSIYCGCTSAPAYAPFGGSNMAATYWLLWNWYPVAGATGYKWNNVDDYLTANDNGFSTSLYQTNLNCESTDTIYVWAYNGCGHGPSKMFFNSTGACPCGGNPIFIDPRDSNEYFVISIGSQCWMKENLKYDTSLIGNAYKFCYDPPTCMDYEMYYDWEAAMQGAASTNADPSGVQGICPIGWHLPSDAEWETLETTLGGEMLAGGEMKDIAFWFFPNTGANNNSEFTALPKGYFESGNVYGTGIWAYYWSTTEETSTEAWSRHLRFDDASLFRMNEQKTKGFSVRCIKD